MVVDQAILIQVKQRELRHRQLVPTKPEGAYSQPRSPRRAARPLTATVRSALAIVRVWISVRLAGVRDQDVRALGALPRGRRGRAID